MEDKELLELAAKAAGLHVKVAGNSGMGLKVHGNCNWWNPLTDDGDSLRLAVTLGFVIGRNPAGTIIYAGLWDSPKWGVVDVENGDYIAATRRAITRAAAQIGKEMK